jgi:hypothetical protein
VAGKFTCVVTVTMEEGDALFAIEDEIHLGAQGVDASEWGM